MITLYQLRWSHYVEKVRLALTYMGLPFRTLDIDAFTKRDFDGREKPAHLPAYTVPAIHDARSDAFVMDSSAILDYLARTYPDAPALFPGDAANRAAIARRLVEFDSMLGLCARRFGYTQVILECPGLLAELFLRGRLARLCRPRPLRWMAGHAIGVVLAKRFDFHRSDALKLYEALEAWLVALADRLDYREFVVGDAFSAADLALAAQLRPLRIVPWFREHPRLQGLFARQEAVFARFGAERFPYEVAIDAARIRRAPVRRRAVDGVAALPFEHGAERAVNDQRTVWDRAMWAMPWNYLVRLRRNKRRRHEAGDGWR